MRHVNTSGKSQPVSVELRSTSRKYWVGFALATVVTCIATGPARAYVQTNLVSDIPGLAIITDPKLVNPWGLSEGPTSPFWTSNQGTNSSTLYSTPGGSAITKINVAPNGFVAIPTTASG